ncbi:hypothetical protein SAMN05661010_00541 [Modicisalibacter muralis]|uniref:Uncharacterized protein n=1 Tax=Modicisalibacter muralis TaxID=119000 RepID=A0A1G9FXB2_9GAMM|nr:hypothetical protein [Halomonas muralis]SDK93106.1 hypothetical protein SAMN05661010_00541 [Halomonas muralis]
MALGLGSWLKRRKHPTVWVIKQLDESLMHLCGQATAQGRGSAAVQLDRLRAGAFSGAVRMTENSAILNAAQFAALIPEVDLHLIDDNEAEWQGRRWQVAWVPQRCWLHDGRLVTQRTELHGKTHLVSIEDVSGIRAKAETPRYHNPFITLEPLEQPQHENDDSPAQHHRQDNDGRDG